MRFNSTVVFASYFCTKDLYMNSGDLSFKKEKFYRSAEQTDYNFDLVLIDEQGDRHLLGDVWSQYFFARHKIRIKYKIPVK